MLELYERLVTHLREVWVGMTLNQKVVTGGAMAALLVASMVISTLGDRMIQYTVLFDTKRFNEHELNQLLNSYCPTLLYPYVARVISTATVDAGFPPLHLTPVNFDALYQEQLKQAKNKQAADNLTHTYPTVNKVETMQ